MIYSLIFRTRSFVIRYSKWYRNVTIPKAVNYVIEIVAQLKSRVAPCKCAESSSKNVEWKKQLSGINFSNGAKYKSCHGVHIKSIKQTKSVASWRNSGVSIIELSIIYLFCFIESTCVVWIRIWFAKCLFLTIYCFLNQVINWRYLPQTRRLQRYYDWTTQKLYLMQSIRHKLTRTIPSADPLRYTERN